MTRRFLFVVLTCCLALLSARDVHAQPEGVPCEAEPTDQTMAYGDHLAPCALEVVGDSDLFRFAGTSGEVISARVVDQTGSYVVWCSLQLLRPDGTVAASASDVFLCEIQIALEASGIFTLRVTEGYLGSPMTYSVALERLFPTSTTAASINPGDSITGASISPRGDVDWFVFRGMAGSLISLRATDQTGSQVVWCALELYAPDGSLLATSLQERDCVIETSLTESGYFTFRVGERGDDAGMTYGLQYQCLVGSCPSEHRLNVTRIGLGRLSSAPPGIECGADCSERYSDGTVVDLVATPDSGWYFAGWSAEEDCVDGTVTMNASRTCIGTFAPVPPPPMAGDDAFTMTANTALDVPAPGVLGNDSSNGGGAMSAALVSSTSHGAVALRVSGGFSYLPASNFVGTDTFNYRATTGAGASNVATVTITVTQPTAVQPPSNLVVDSVSGQLVTVRFEAPLFGPAPAGYVLRGGLTPGQTLASIPTGSAAPAFTFVAPAGSFFIRMHSVAGGVESGPSNEVSLHVNVPVAPSVPANLAGMANGSFLALAWKNTYAGGPPSNVILDVMGSFTGSFTLGLAETFQFPAVPPGTYTLAVRAANAGGSSGPSNAVTLTFPSPCSGAPSMPANFLAHRQGSTIFVIWDPPVHGPAPTSYVLNVTGAFVGSIPTAGRILSGTVGPGSYGLSVRAVNPCGNSGFTAQQVVVVP